MQKEQSDLGLVFKKRARRRLVGAVGLVLLMVIILPFVLEDRAETSTQDQITVLMPAGSDEVILSEEIINVEDLKAAEKVKKKALVLSKQKPKAKEQIKKLAPKKVVAKKAEPKKVELKKPAPKPAVQPKSVAKVEPKLATKSNPPIEAKPAVEAPTKAIASTTGNQFYVQIGVFSNIENVKKLQGKLNELGYESVLEKMKSTSGEKTRLRTQSFNGRSEAAIALENIKDAGLTGIVVSQK